MRGPALPIVCCLLSIHRHLVWRAAAPLASGPKPPQRGWWRPRPALHCKTQTRWSVRTCINALCCRAHHQAEWLLFLDFNGGGWWWLAGAGCASCYNQQQLRQPAASSKRSAAAATPGKSGRARATERGKAATIGPTPASQLPAPCLCRPVRTFDLWALPGQSYATQPMIGLEKEEGGWWRTQ